MIGGNPLERLAFSLHSDWATMRLLRKGVEYAKARHHASRSSHVGRAGVGTGDRTHTDPRLSPEVDDKGERPAALPPSLLTPPAP